MTSSIRFILCSISAVSLLPRHSHRGSFAMSCHALADLKQLRLARLPDSYEWQTVRTGLLYANGTPHTYKKAALMGVKALKYALSSSKEGALSR